MKCECGSINVVQSIARKCKCGTFVDVRGERVRIDTLDTDKVYGLGRESLVHRSRSSALEDAIVKHIEGEDVDFVNTLITARDADVDVTEILEDILRSVGGKSGVDSIMHITEILFKVVGITRIILKRREKVPGAAEEHVMTVVKASMRNEVPASLLGGK